MVKIYLLSLMLFITCLVSCIGDEQSTEDLLDVYQVDSKPMSYSYRDTFLIDTLWEYEGKLKYIDSIGYCERNDTSYTGIRLERDTVKLEYYSKVEDGILTWNSAACSSIFWEGSFPSIIGEWLDGDVSYKIPDWYDIDVSCDDTTSNNVSYDNLIFDIEESVKNPFLPEDGYDKNNISTHISIDEKYRVIEYSYSDLCLAELDYLDLDWMSAIPEVKIVDTLSCNSYQVLSNDGADTANIILSEFDMKNNFIHYDLSYKNSTCRLTQIISYQLRNNLTDFDCNWLSNSNVQISEVIYFRKCLRNIGFIAK